MKEMFQSPNTPDEAGRLSSLFREVVSVPGVENHAFEELQDDLEQAGFVPANSDAVAEIFQQQNLLCRSESFEKVLNILIKEQSIIITNDGDEANMCIMASGQGFRVAMNEGFSGREVGGLVKVVLTFSTEHLTKYEPIKKDSRLWETKQGTAKVSLQGKGTIEFDDVEMVSFRFPMKFFPKTLLSEGELDQLDDEKISFVVRHYIPKER